MSYKVETIDNFDKEFKRLCKKYKSLKNEIIDLVKQLEKKPEKGIHLGNDCYKIKLAIKSKGRGKSGGARVITHVKIIEQNIYLLSIYDKSEQVNITEKKINELYKQAYNGF